MALDKKTRQILTESAQNIGKNIEQYSKSAWELLIHEARAEMEGISINRVLGEKKVSMLKRNLSIIKDNNAIVHGYTPSDFEDRVEFTYYEKDANNPDAPTPKPRLVDPHNDGFRKEVMANGGFKLQKSFVDGQKTLTVSNTGRITHFVYNEHLHDDVKASDDSKMGQKGYVDDITGIGSTDYRPIKAEGNSLVGKTNKWMRGVKDDYISRRFKTIISRFHTSNSTADIEELKSNVGNTAMSETYGLSHGRNLLKTDDEGNVISDPLSPYDNPYCRVWTYHHQYNKFVQDTIRPFQYVSAEDLDKTYHWDSMRTSAHDGFASGNARLRKYGVMYDNNGKTTGLVNITPKSDGNGIKGVGGVDITHCMFSIENLAWKGMFNDYGEEMEENGLSIDQKGPFGGRIMWFPPYNIKFSENTQANWNANEFIGRGEPIFTYSNTRRSGNLSFTMLIDHPSILDYWERRNMGQGGRGDGGVDDTKSKEQQMLRFFAGCDILKAGLPPQEPVVEPEIMIEKEPPVDEEDNVFQFFVFYPNNYSGKDDSVTRGDVNPIHYLMGGVGTQKYIADDNDEPLMEQTESDTGWTKDFPVDFSKEVIVNGTIYGGYEIRKNVGISGIKTQTNNNLIALASVGDKDRMLVKLLPKEREKTSLTCEGLRGEQLKEWHKQRYYYRADKDTLTQKLIGDKNDGAVSYIDKDSYQFNSKGVLDAAKYWNIKNVDKTFSLAEMFTVLEPEYAYYSQEFCREGKVEELKKIIDKYKTKITKIVFRGRASSQANNARENVNIERNKTLARYRANTVKEWMQEKLKGVNVANFCKDDSLQFDIDRTRNEKVQDDSNDRLAKLNRFCLVEIHYKTEDVDDASKAVVSVDASGTPENYSTSVVNNSKELTQEEKDERIQEEQDSRFRTKSMGVTRNKYKRYDDEYKFFDKIHENAPFAEKLMSERVKVFNPAFHSMSPEGFSARLNFLHQCTRQGPTMSNSDSLGANATNLSFGRPPVCVLRIGDFYYTKIIINSMSIDYDPMEWDLNDEGIGVMPMMANINIGFDFIGGSDLSGPIARLQNALSFNFYSNSSVYDNRAEQVEYKEGTMGKVKSYKPYLGPVNEL